MSRGNLEQTELIWPGKYNEDGSRNEVTYSNLPFQVIETINQSRATREAQKKGIQQSLFSVYHGNESETFEGGWKNKLIWGENSLVMGSLLGNFSGKVDLIYIDPPFATGADFSFVTHIGDDNLELLKEQSIIEEKAYRDTWGAGMASYLQMMYPRLALMRELLSKSGSIYVHCDYRVVAYMRLLMDELFGAENFINEIIWYFSQGGKGAKYFARKHNTLLLYGRSNSPFFNSNEIRLPFTPHKQDGSGKNYGGRMGVDEDGREYVEKWGTGRKKLYRYYLDEGKLPEDVWTDIQSIQSAATERVDYPTQKPEALLERVIKASCPPGGLVADFFCGSGTSLVVAEKLGRRWLGCDLGRFAVHTTRKRLLSYENCKAFEILNLGKYERRYWQIATFGEDLDADGQIALYEYLAFILKLYMAQPVSGMIHLHGKKERAMVHIGAVDAPVTIDEINAALDECLQLHQPELDVLGWEWEMGLYELMIEEADRRGVKLRLLQIPREVMEQQAVDKDDVRFFELAYLEAEITKTHHVSGNSVVVQLNDFVIPNTELIPEAVREKVSRWSDYIDYWAVDWDFQNDTFMQGFVTYRSRQDRRLAVRSDPNVYNNSGTYRILVKVIDIFGNDTSQVFNLEVP